MGQRGYIITCTIYGRKRLIKEHYVGRQQKVKFFPSNQHTFLTDSLTVLCTRLTAIITHLRTLIQPSANIQIQISMDGYPNPNDLQLISPRAPKLPYPSRPVHLHSLRDSRHMAPILYLPEISHFQRNCANVNVSFVLTTPFVLHPSEES